MFIRMLGTNYAADTVLISLFSRTTSSTCIREVLMFIFSQTHILCTRKGSLPNHAIFYPFGGGTPLLINGYIKRSSYFGSKDRTRKKHLYKLQQMAERGPAEGILRRF